MEEGGAAAATPTSGAVEATPCVAEAAASSAGKTKAEAKAKDKANAKAKDKAPKVKSEGFKDQVKEGDIIHLNCRKNKSDYNYHDAEVIGRLTNMVKVKFLEGPSKGTVNKFRSTTLQRSSKARGKRLALPPQPQARRRLLRRWQQHSALRRALRALGQRTSM